MAIAAAVLALAVPSPASAQDQPPTPPLQQSAEIEMKLQRDGSLSVAEAVSVPDGTRMTQRIPLREPAGNDRDRVFGVRDVVIEGSGTADLSGGSFAVHLDPGTSVVHYIVDGVVRVSDGLPRVNWELTGGWDAGLKLVRASFAAPNIPRSVRCVTGGPDSGQTCGAAQIDHVGLTRFSQQDLPAGGRMDVEIELPAGTVPGNQRLEPADTFAGAFVLTAPVGWAWSGFALLLCAGAGVVLWLRRRDGKEGEQLPVDVLSEDGVFASPEGALPGHLGPVLAGRAGTLDAAGTVLDLAVRNYLWVSEVRDTGPPDWRLTRRNPLDEQLTAYERAVFAEVFGDAESVTLSGLRAAGGVRLDRVRPALYADLVLRRWFRRAPDHGGGGRPGRAGVRIVFYGVFVTVLLALTVGYAQLGLILMLAGAAVALGSRALPARIERGRVLRSRLLGLLEKLAGTRARGVPKLERDLVFSRGLPYALVLGEARTWLSAFGELNRPPEPYWYAAEDREAGTRLQAVGEFLAALTGAVSGSRTRAAPSLVAPHP
jgi:hypothetical protein